HKENTVVIAGKTYTASTLKKESPVDKNYTTTTIPGVSLNKSTMILSIGKKGTFIPSGNKKAVTWTSSSKTVAVVDKKGKVTAKKAGTAVITMKTDGKTYQCRVCVNNKA
ncbi:MAG: Ig-like domain-containing protein, partial [Lachnospiraceae bacterium]|nr:Ig-like domain-containing protein [Lachnospiraceae bacterium]